MSCTYCWNCRKFLVKMESKSKEHCPKRAICLNNQATATIPSNCLQNWESVRSFVTVNCPNCHIDYSWPFFFLFLSQIPSLIPSINIKFSFMEFIRIVLEKSAFKKRINSMWHVFLRLLTIRDEINCDQFRKSGNTGCKLPECIYTHCCSFTAFRYNLTLTI